MSHRCCKPKVNPFPFSSPQQVIPFCLPLQKRGGVRGRFCSPPSSHPCHLEKSRGVERPPPHKNEYEGGGKEGRARLHTQKKEERRIAHVWLTMTRKKRRGWMEVSSHRNIFPSFHCLMVLLAWGWFRGRLFFVPSSTKPYGNWVKGGRYYPSLFCRKYGAISSYTLFFQWDYFRYGSQFPNCSRISTQLFSFCES